MLRLCGETWIVYLFRVGHDRIDRRSLELHRLVAEKIRQQPGMMDFVREKLNRSLSESRLSESCKDALREWQTLLACRSTEEVLDIITEDSEEGQRLRHSTPFSGILSQPERMEVFRRYEPAGV
jgi:hypothetical protein